MTPHTNVPSDEKEVAITKIEDVLVDLKKSYVQWLITENEFRPIGRSTSELYPGFYKLKFDHNIGVGYLQKQRISAEKIIEFPDPTLSNIIKDIETFWKSKDLYDSYEYVFKRGYLLYGPPGCGKTSVIYLLSEKLINIHRGIVINIQTVDDLYRLEEIIESIKTIEPDKHIILVFEDIDNFTDSDKEVMSKLLNILDGNLRIDNCVVIATTNYPEKLKERISNRPSRFDVRYEIKLPSPDIRRYYIEKFLKPEDIKDVDVDKLVKDSEGFTIDHLKELILSVFILKKDYEFALDEIHTMKDNGSIKSTPLSKPKSVGFIKQQSDQS